MNYHDKYFANETVQITGVRFFDGLCSCQGNWVINIFKYIQYIQYIQYVIFVVTIPNIWGTINTLGSDSVGEVD